MSTIVEAGCLTKRFGDLTAIDSISFSLQAGKIYGLLGRNGSGKTTLLRLLTAQLFATDGTLLVFGEEPYENRRVLSQICFMKENQKYPRRWRVGDVLAMAASFFPRWDANYTSALSKDFQLPLARKVRTLSRGMLSALGIVVGLASRTPLSIFDEPLGLDVVARSLFYERLIDDYVKHPRTILISTHLIDEVSRLLEHVLVLDQGRLIIDEEAEALRTCAFTVTGSAEEVATFTEGRTQIGGEQFGALVSAVLLGNADAGERKQAAALGLELTPVSLQQLIIHLTSTTSHRNDGSLIEQLWIYFVLMANLYFLGFVIGSIYRRIGGAGTLMFFLVVLLLVSLFALVWTSLRWWGALFHWFSQYTAFELALLLLPLTVLYLLSSYLLLRRAVV